MLSDGPLNSLPLSGITDAQVTQTETRTLRFASRSFVTRSTDAPAHEFIDGRIARGLRLSRNLNQAEGGQFGALIETRRDDIYLDNRDGALDYLVDEYAADGRQIRLKIGATEFVGRERVQPFADFALVYTTVAGPWTFEHGTVKLRIESLTNRLQNRLQQQTYSGTGGQNGPEDLAGHTLPLAFGRCLNVPMKMVDPALLIGQLHGGSLDSITSVFDAGIAVAFQEDFSTYAELEAATIEAGLYASSVATGFIRLGSIPVGAVTANIRGSNLNDGFVGYTDQHAPIIRKILLAYSGFTSSELDLTSFTTFDALQSESIGIFFPSGDQSTILEAIEAIAFSGGGFFGQDRSGLLRIQRLDPPPDSPVDWSFDDREIIDIERIDLPYGVPWKAWGVGYQRNWTIQTEADLATDVSQFRRQFLGAETRYAYTQSAAIALRHASSSGAPLRPALFLDATSAATEAARLAGLYNDTMALYRFVVKTALFSVEVGHTVRLTYKRWQLDGGKNFVAVGIEDDADRVATTLTVFG